MSWCATLAEQAIPASSTPRTLRKGMALPDPCRDVVKRRPRSSVVIRHCIVHFSG